MDYTALRLAIGVMHSPTRVRGARASQLPSGVDLLLQVAAGDQAVLEEAAEELDRPAATVREAAIFFVEQVLLDPRSDCYRTLGETAGASSTKLRRNMALLLRGLHPDLHEGEDKQAFAFRVTQAWNQLKTSELRARYDSMILPAVNKEIRVKAEPRLSSRPPAPGGRKPVAIRGRSGFLPVAPAPVPRMTLLKRILLMLFGQDNSPRARP